MKIKTIQISNILSFKYFDNILEATNIPFDSDLNIFIGQNGAGKSTALEVINFVFKKVLFRHFSINQDYYSRRDTLPFDNRKQIIRPDQTNTYNDFRLDANWNSEEKPQSIRLVLELDEIDDANIAHLMTHKSKLLQFGSSYTEHPSKLDTVTQREYVVDVTLDKVKKAFSAKISPQNDAGHDYLVNYNFYRELIALYNYENPQNGIDPLFESFILIGGYRNYNSFTPGVSIQGQTATHQIQDIQTQEHLRSLNTNEQAEPRIFNLVRLRVAAKHYELYGEAQNGAQCEEMANNQEFLKKINNRLKIVNLEVKIKFTSKQNWRYSFNFYDLKRQKPLADINSLSAGQKAIIHLVFEAYGRGELKGGVVIIDEPEIHLHYQFQNEYLRVIEEINKEQKCQYVLVTHSESLINSSTIHSVKRFALDADNYSMIKYPSVTTDQKNLVKILDNTRSTYAFFAKKVLLVEGETDRYFYSALIHESAKHSIQEIAVLDINGKANENMWRNFFESFGLQVFFIGDLDAACDKIYSINPAPRIRSLEEIAAFKADYPDIIQRIDAAYNDGIFILKQGGLETYLGLHNKGLSEVIRFCNSQFETYLGSRSNSHVAELMVILDRIITA